ncbi:MAG: hypothetical protein N2999_06135 [Proteobacteria bacterium]|nr:hypothetical protein [Pseudomonadota bacterium]
MISLRKEIYNTTYLHPKKNFEKTDVFAEMRYDPLTGHRVRVYGIEWRTKKVDFYQLGEKSRHRCPFCEGVLEKMVARFPKDFVEKGYFEKGQSILIPNILPYAENAGVVVLTRNHIVPMGKMEEETICDGISLILDYAKEVSLYKKKEYNFAHLHWNYMPTSGGSLIHPHMQVYVTDTPLNYHSRVLEKAKDFKKEKGLEFFSQYVKKEEQEKERFVFRKGRCVVLAPFASRGMLGEFLVILEDSFNYKQISDDDIKDLGNIIKKLSLFFEAKDIPGFNLALFSSPLNEDIILNHIRVYPRVYRDIEIFATDVETPTLLYGESFCLVSPEKNAEDFRTFLETGCDNWQAKA